jgi:hypothetical protein
MTSYNLNVIRKTYKESGQRSGLRGESVDNLDSYKQERT